LSGGSDGRSRCAATLCCVAKARRAQPELRVSQSLAAPHRACSRRRCRSRSHAPEGGCVHRELHLAGRDGRQLVEGRGVVGRQQLRRADHPGRPRFKAVCARQRQRLRSCTRARVVVRVGCRCGSGGCGRASAWQPPAPDSRQHHGHNQAAASTTHLPRQQPLAVLGLQRLVVHVTVVLAPAGVRCERTHTQRMQGTHAHTHTHTCWSPQSRGVEARIQGAHTFLSRTQQHAHARAARPHL
jgi:hypothetical protein